MGNLGTSARSVGLRIQNTDSSQRLNRLSTSINGDVQVGWDVELYRNDVLLDQIFDIESNRYEFNDVDLLFGRNEFEIVLYGPQGQIIRETKTEIVDDATLSTDAWSYQASIVRLNDSLFNSLDDNADNSMVAAVALGTNIGDHSSLDLSFQTGLDSSEYLYAAVGFNSRLFSNLLFGITADSDLSDLARLSTSLRTSVAGQSITLANSLNYTKGEDGNPDTQIFSSNVTLAGSLDFIGLPSISYSTDFGYSDNGDNSTTFADSSIRWSTPFGSLFYSLNYVDEPGVIPLITEPDALNPFPVFATDRLTGGFGYQGSIGPVFTRINASYDATDSYEIDAVSGSFTWNPSNNLKSRLLVTRNLITDLTDYNLSLTWRHNQLSVGGEARYSDLSGYTIGLNTRFSFGGLPYNDAIFTTRDALSSNGTIAVRVFEDLNGNNAFDQGEPLIPNIEVQSSTNRAKELTGVDGIALIQNLSVARTTDIRLENQNLDQPFLMPVIEGVSIQPRDGFIDRLDFPMVQGSEIEGTVYLPGTQKRAAAYAKLVLKENNRIVRVIEPEFDGYFLITEVPPGFYTIEVDSAYAAENEFKPKLSGVIAIKNKSEVHVLEDLTITQQPFEDGYIVNLGLYSDGSLASAQALLFKKKMTALSLPPTLEVIKLAENGVEKFVVAAAVVRDAQLGRKYCQYMAQQSIECSVIDYRIRIPI